MYQAGEESISIFDLEAGYGSGPVRYRDKKKLTARSRRKKLHTSTSEEERSSSLLNLRYLPPIHDSKFVFLGLVCPSVKIV